MCQNEYLWSEGLNCQYLTIEAVLGIYFIWKKLWTKEGVISLSTPPHLESNHTYDVRYWLNM